MAKKNISIALSEPLAQFAERKVASGEFGSTTDVVDEAMRQYMAEEAKMLALRQALIEGENSGPAQPWDVEEFLDNRRRRP